MHASLVRRPCVSVDLGAGGGEGGDFRHTHKMGGTVVVQRREDVQHTGGGEKQRFCSALYGRL